MKPEDTVKYLEFIKKHDKLFEEKQKRTPLIVYVVAVALISVFAFLTYLAWKSKSDLGLALAIGGLIGSVIGSLKAIAKADGREEKTVWVPDDDDEEHRKHYKFLIDPVNPASPLYQTEEE